MSYLTVKHLHLTCVLLSLVLFLIRGTWALYYPAKLEQRWIKILPHLIDTVLLISAVSLVVMLQQYPLVHGWLTAKVIALCVYIALGSYVLKSSATQPKKLLAFFAAVATFGYIISVALTRMPLPWTM